MLRTLKRAIGNALKARGYVIRRPTEIEQTYLKSAWAEWFAKDVSTFAEIYTANRKSLTRVPKWASEEMLSQSLWRYGVPEMWSGSAKASGGNGLLDSIAEISSADLLVLLARRFKHLNYFEIGVSVGKNLVQIADAFPNALLTGLDVESINPYLADLFETQTELWAGAEEYKVDTLSGVQRNKRSSLTRLTRGNQVFDYLSADQFRDDTWARFDGLKFNFIFSDGVHSGAALRSEFDFLTKHHLIDTYGNFVMFWDDLWGDDMQSAFLDNAQKLCALFKVDQSHIAMFQLHGSYGMQRPMGLFSSFK